MQFEIIFSSDFKMHSEPLTLFIFEGLVQYEGADIFNWFAKSFKEDSSLYLLKFGKSAK